MKKISLFISLALLFCTTLVSAHGPVRGKLTATVTIDASAEKVWNVIGNYDNLSWLPAAESVTADNGTDNVTHLNDANSTNDDVYNEKPDRIA